MSIETKNHELVDEKTNDTEKVSNDVEVNRQNDTTIDKDNSRSVDNISNKMDSADEITAEKDDVMCLLDGIEEPDWIKDSDWISDPNNGLEEIKLWNTIPKKQNFMPTIEKVEPFIDYNTLEPKFISEEIKHDPRALVLIDFQRVLIPYESSTNTEELRNSASVRALQEAARNGAVIEAVLTDPTGIIPIPN